ncbi:thioesterase domain-containing protein [Paenibacillus dakarensis]|uniref:thioesterase domain-containing protein n=1 Tax=Paenibacillus dakarensis TaxID=1527293 RepID=UPI0006D5B42B|nr:thioesterase domain-containing protein [Paenibacillus dakarensis]
MFVTLISSNSTCNADCRTVIFFFAGVLTYRNNFEDAARELALKYRNAKIVAIFPYGTANGLEGRSLMRLLVRQLAQAGYDLSHDRSKRVIEASQIIRDHAESAKLLILIGHSAGGVIAYRTALYLEESFGLRCTQVFAVGSPKFHLKDIPFNERFTYITGQNPDRVTHIGRWRKRGSKVYRGKPGREIQLEFNPDHQKWRFHASYFLKSSWNDSNKILHTNSEDLMAKIYEIVPGDS